MNRFALAVLLLVSAAFRLSAQLQVGYASPVLANSIFEFSNTRIFESPRDSIPADTSKPKRHSPKTAAIMSACLPGLGQIYNKKYWKLGIIYPALGGLTYGIIWNHQSFKIYRDALRARYDDDSTTIDPLSSYSDDYIVTSKNYYQRYRDLCVIGFAAVYVLQVIDAAVDAHLFYFDVGPDLSLRWAPKYNGQVAGLTLNLSFR